MKFTYKNANEEFQIDIINIYATVTAGFSIKVLKKM